MMGILLLCIAAALWGTTGVASNLMTNRAVDPALLGLSRTTLGAVSLLVVAEAIRVPWSRRPPLMRLAAFGICGALFQVCLFAAFARVGVTVTVAVTVCVPVVIVALYEALLQWRWPAASVVMAIAIASLGIVLSLPAEDPRTIAAHGVDWTGSALLLVGSVAFAGVAGLAREISRDLHPLQATGLGLGIAAIVMGAGVLCAPGSEGVTLGGLPRRDLVILLYIGVAATGGAYLAFVAGLRRSRSAASGLGATLIEPGVAALLAAAVLGEPLALSQAAGCLLMLIAMVVLFRTEQRPGAPGMADGAIDQTTAPAAPQEASAP